MMPDEIYELVKSLVPNFEEVYEFISNSSESWKNIDKVNENRIIAISNMILAKNDDRDCNCEFCGAPAEAH